MGKIAKLIQEYWNFELIANASLLDEEDCTDLLYQTGSVEQLINRTDYTLQDKLILTELVNTKIERIHINNYEDKYQIIAAIIYLKRKILNDTLEIEESLDIFKQFFWNSAYRISKIYVVKLLIDYYDRADFEKKKQFFVPMKHGVSIHYFLFFLHSVTDTIGGKRYWDIYSGNMRYFLNFRNLQHNYKIAICFYGVLRGNWKENLCRLLSQVQNLNADCFLSTWNEYQEWPGFMGGLNWGDRCFTEEINSKIPKNIKSKDDFKKYLPNTARLFESEFFSKVNSSDIENIQKEFISFKKYCMQPQPDFHTTSRGRIMYYGMYNACKLIEEYENKENKKYDFIILLRTDIELRDIIDPSNVYNLQGDEISDYYTLWGGSGSGNFAGRRNTIMRYASLYKQFDILEKNEYIKNMYDNHEVSYKFLALNEIRLVKQIIPFNFQNDLIKIGYKIPDFRNALLCDFKQCLLKDKDILSEWNNFFLNIMNEYPTVSCYSRRFNRFEQFCRTQEMLCYKLGITFLEGKGKLINFFYMPFKLWSIWKKNKIYHNKNIDELDSYTIDLACEIGKKIIRAHKNWYKGGYIRLSVELFLIFIKNR
ncbi:hypothetical protein C6S66_03830 [Campylobacter lari]|uniref:hypothetical protein n=1 Tax=Campylobacter lari TaxID=201 RepID=UPI00127126D8|nr:hypothetical protein [Campylobacter lari]EFU2421579.1 hypothetical protein [Campylobacter coli]EAI0925129.1 hypothetical protein [Campylobacter lari]EAI2991782.1 hypothetical protein [Campylobacter lari]EAI3095144.1 hypothetical protein [Campylobacter lari]EAI6175182.1 hypothetical protein [Campylobacter lari]